MDTILVTVDRFIREIVLRDEVLFVEVYGDMANILDGYEKG